jgi:hypothetical protein
MQTGKNNKSCRIFHNRSNKIEFAFFWNYHDFIRNLQESAKHLHYLRFTFAPGSLGLFDTSQICPWFTKNSLERMESPQLGPRGRPPAALLAEGGGGLVAHLWIDLRARRGSRSGRRWWTAAPGGDHRGSSCSGEAAARLRTRAKWRATARAGEGGRHYSWGTRPMELGLATTVLTGAGGRLRPGRQGVRP